jgi:hypothetical protein
VVSTTGTFTHSTAAFVKPVKALDELKARRRHVVFFTSDNAEATA